jgi:uncharacterized protein YjbI with pentapeptide repeats
MKEETLSELKITLEAWLAAKALLLEAHRRWVANNEALEIAQFKGEAADLADGAYRFDFAKEDLSMANLAGAILEYAVLREARLMGADFGEANLTMAEFTRANLHLADFTGADLSKATFSEKRDEVWR